jgi:uncharacterized membrane protein
MTAYICGTSTRKVDDLVKALGCDTGVPPSSFRWRTFRLVGKVVVSIPLAMLRPGVNTIGLASGQLGPNPGDNAHDDFVFGEVVLILSS